MGRGGVWVRIWIRRSEKLGYQYHTAELRSIEQARKVYRIIRDELAV
jgi:hypothetical protein